MYTPTCAGASRRHGQRIDATGHVDRGSSGAVARRRLRQRHYRQEAEEEGEEEEEAIVQTAHVRRD